MNPIDFAELLNELPDDMICSANDADYRKRHRISYIISALAASVVLIISAAFYLKLRTEKPSLLLRSDSENQTSKEYQTTTDSAESHTDVTTISVSGNQEDVQSTSESTVFASATRDTINSTTTAAENTESSLTTAFTTSQTTSSCSSVTEITTNTGASEYTTSFSSASGMLEETTTLTHTTTHRPPDNPQFAWTLNAKTVESDSRSPFSDLQIAVYRDGLPYHSDYKVQPDIDFDHYNCVIILFQTVGYDALISQQFYSDKRKIGIHLLIAPASSSGTVQNITIASAVPKNLDISDVSDGITVWCDVASSNEVFAQSKAYYAEYGIQIIHEDF